MTISHPDIKAEDGEAVVFADLMGFTCSICAPSSWDIGRVVAFAEEKFPSTAARWVSIDKSKLGKPGSFGSPTPNPCNQYPGRTHYFMMRGDAMLHLTRG